GRQEAARRRRLICPSGRRRQDGPAVAPPGSARPDQGVPLRRPVCPREIEAGREAEQGVERLGGQLPGLRSDGSGPGGQAADAGPGKAVTGRATAAPSPSHLLYAASTGLVSSPRPSISIVISSP